ncbi:aldo/keto reductase [Actinophytocola algeriensis]|uniref:aldo/keto reductase n=1 Tax=Actinophytocola algeriensis TaxID=1768010 RepID=UPI00298EE4B9|nr:aldo/keto reductase [Actinophytocola algeriensis]
MTSWVGAGLVLPYYGAEDFGPHALARHPPATCWRLKIDGMSTDVPTVSLPGGTWSLGELTVTRFGYGAMQRGGRSPARRPADLRRAVHEDLDTLGLERLDLVNLRLGDAQGPRPGSLAEAFGTLVELRSSALSAVAARLGTTPMSVALAWLLRRSPNILLVAGTSSVAHPTENVAGAGIRLSDDDLAELDGIGVRHGVAG